MAYSYDVFFSYKRDAQSDDWHLTVKEMLRFWLGQELRRDVEIFIDTEDIRAGMRWKTRIADALRQSRTIACIWSPLYFQSRWCVSEWKTFMERERLCDRDLIAPASFHDGECFPAEAKARQVTDFSEYTFIAPFFWKTNGAVEFEKRRLKPFAEDLAKLIRQAPPYSENFPVVEATADDVAPEAPIVRIAHA
jgi:hypothetical protein